MGIIEAIILGIYALGSTWFNLQQASEIGALEVENKRLRTVEEQCVVNAQRQRELSLDASNDRITKEQQDRTAIIEHREGVYKALAANGNDCLNTSVDGLGDSLLDSQRKLVDKLHNNRVQSEP